MWEIYNILQNRNWYLTYCVNFLRTCSKFVRKHLRGIWHTGSRFTFDWNIKGIRANKFATLAAVPFNFKCIQEAGGDNMRSSRARIEFAENARKRFFAQPRPISQQDERPLIYPFEFRSLDDATRASARLILSFTIDEVATSDVTPCSKSSSLADKMFFRALQVLVFDTKQWLLIVFARQ